MEIPTYPESRLLALSDKPRLDDIFQQLQPKVSELTFAGLFLFRAAHDYRLTMVGDSLVVLGRGYTGGKYFLPPLGGDIATVLSALFDAGWELYGADEPFVAAYLQDTGLDVRADRDSFDYLYLRQEMADLPGNRYHKKKNRVNYFARRHDFTIEFYDQAHLAGCRSLLAEWRRVRADLDSPSLNQEVAANEEALRLAGELDLQGVVVLVGGEVKAFALGERLNRQTAVCHFEKADPFLDGLYQLVDREFNRLCFVDCIYINREQDLGEPNLRESKLSYHPLELVKKFRALRSGS